jgi:hypothetical protein
LKDRKLHYVYNFLGLMSEQYMPFFPFEGGWIVKVEISVCDDAYVDLEQHMAAALARD